MRNTTTGIMKDSDDPRAQARAWVAKLHAGEPGKSERAQLDAWLEGSDENRQAFERAEADWRSLTEFRDGLAASLEVARKARPSLVKRLRKPITVAVAVLLLAPVIYEGVIGETQRWQTAIGEHSEILLADGSRLSLNTATQVEIRLTWFARTVSMKSGEIYLDVAPDARPLNVQTPHLDVHDIGTRFTVRDTGEHLEVGVLQGLVEVKTDNQYLRVKAGQKVAGENLDRALRVTSVPPDSDAWREGWLAYYDAPIAQVVAELSRYHGVNVRLADPGLGQHTINGRFRIGELDHALGVIADALALRIEQTSPGAITLRRTQN